MFLMTWSNLILVFDMRTLQISQVLEYTLPDSTGENFKWSKQGRMLIVVCSSSHPDRKNIVTSNCTLLNLVTNYLYLLLVSQICY